MEKNLNMPPNLVKSQSKKQEPEINKNYGTGAEARLRQSEFRSKPMVTQSEARIRMQEQRLMT